MAKSPDPVSKGRCPPPPPLLLLLLLVLLVLLVLLLLLILRNTNMPILTLPPPPRQLGLDVCPPSPPPTIPPLPPLPRFKPPSLNNSTARPCRCGCSVISCGAIRCRSMRRATPEGAGCPPGGRQPRVTPGGQSGAAPREPVRARPRGGDGPPQSQGRPPAQRSARPACPPVGMAPAAPMGPTHREAPDYLRVVCRTNIYVISVPIYEYNTITIIIMLLLLLLHEMRRCAMTVHGPMCVEAL